MSCCLFSIAVFLGFIPAVFVIVVIVATAATAATDVFFRADFLFFSSSSCYWYFSLIFQSHLFRFLRVLTT